MPNHSFSMSKTSIPYKETYIKKIKSKMDMPDIGVKKGEIGGCIEYEYNLYASEKETEVSNTWVDEDTVVIGKYSRVNYETVCTGNTLVENSEVRSSKVINSYIKDMNISRAIIEDSIIKLDITGEFRNINSDRYIGFYFERFISGNNGAIYYFKDANIISRADYEVFDVECFGVSFIIYKTKDNHFNVSTYIGGMVTYADNIVPLIEYLLTKITPFNLSFTSRFNASDIVPELGNIKIHFITQFYKFIRDYKKCLEKFGCRDRMLDLIYDNGFMADFTVKLNNNIPEYKIRPINYVDFGNINIHYYDEGKLEIPYTDNLLTQFKKDLTKLGIPFDLDSIGFDMFYLGVDTDKPEEKK